jgi:hypothetical protein
LSSIALNSGGMYVGGDRALGIISLLKYPAVF